MATRKELEEHWRSRVTQTQVRYRQASLKCGTALQEWGDGMMPSPDGFHALRKARQEEAAALQEYVRVLRIFRDLIVDGRIPAEK